MTDYRALREGREVVKVPIEGLNEPEPKPAAQPPAAPGESGSDSGTEEHVEEQESDSDEGKQPEDKQQDQEKKPGAKPKGLVQEVIQLRRENRELKARVTPPPPPPPQDQPKPASAPAVSGPGAAAGIDASKLGADGMPDANKYSDYQEFSRDTIRAEFFRLQEQQTKQAQQREAEAAFRNREDAWKQRVIAAAAKPELPNFDAIAFNTTLKVSTVMAEAIKESELGPEMLYHLGLHPDEAARIEKLSPVSQVRELGKLEALLSKPVADTGGAPPDDEPAPQKTAISKAPAPIPRPAGSVSKTNPAKNLEGMSQAEYRALREAGRL
jgi:hypothetical protein